MHISDVLRNKGGTVATVGPGISVRDAVAELAAHNVGALVVIENDAVIGILSERDVVRRLHEREASLLDAAVGDIMTTTVHTCLPSDSLDSLAAVMTEHRIRHLPVVEASGLVGIVSIGDVVKGRIDELQAEREHLESYIAQG